LIFATIVTEASAEWRGEGVSPSSFVKKRRRTGAVLVVFISWFETDCESDLSDALTVHYKSISYK